MTRYIQLLGLWLRCTSIGHTSDLSWRRKLFLQCLSSPDPIVLAKGIICSCLVCHTSEQGEHVAQLARSMTRTTVNRPDTTHLDDTHIGVILPKPCGKAWLVKTGLLKHVYGLVSVVDTHPILITLSHRSCRSKHKRRPGLVFPAL